MPARSKLTSALIVEFEALLRSGESFAAACDRVGVADATAHRWRRRGERETGTLRARFAVAVLDARQLGAVGPLGEGDLVALVERQARNGSIRAAQWLLERQWPERWARVRGRPRAAGSDESLVDPFEALDELAARRPARIRPESLRDGPEGA